MEKKKKTKGPVAFFGLSLAFIASFFIFNPDWSIIDVMPDFFGYFLLCLSLVKLRDLNSYFEKAASLFAKAAIVSGSKFASIFVLARMNAKESATMTLILMFGFGIGELILILPAWVAFFDGFSFFGFSYEGKKGKSYADKIRKSTIAFVITKQIITILPEFSVLTEHEYIDDNQVKWYEFTSLFRTLAVAVVFIIGIIWLVKILRFLAKTVKQTDVLNEAMDYYRTHVVKRTGIFELRRISWVLVLGTCGILFFCDLHMDGMNLLPDCLSGLFFTLFFVFSKYSGKLKIPGIVLSAIYFPLLLITDVKYAGFESAGSLSLVRIDPKAWNAFWQWYPYRFAGTVLMAAIVVLYLVTLKTIINNHCGYVPDEISENYKSNRERELKRKLILWVVLSAISAVLSLTFSCVAEYLQTFTSIWWLNGAGVVAFFAEVLSLLSFTRLAYMIYDNAKLRYMLK